MTITAALVKELRERTGAGMMDCKKALQEANGDIEQAIEEMRQGEGVHVLELVSVPTFERSIHLFQCFQEIPHRRGGMV